MLCKHTDISIACSLLIVIHCNVFLAIKYSKDNSIVWWPLPGALLLQLLVLLVLLLLLLLPLQLLLLWPLSPDELDAISSLWISYPNKEFGDFSFVWKFDGSQCLHYSLWSRANIASESPWTLSPGTDHQSPSEYSTLSDQSICWRLRLALDNRQWLNWI